MVSIGDILSNPFVAFLLGLIPSLIVALIIEYVRDYRSKIRSREESLQPHLWKLHTITSKILEEECARNVRTKYHEMQKAKTQYQINKQSDEKEGNGNLESRGDYITALLSFSYSCNCADRLIKKCVDFESEYQQMDANGLISLLKKRQNATYIKIADLHRYAETVVALTERLREENLIKSEAKNMKALEDNQQTEYLSVLFSLHEVVEVLFIRAPEVERELKKFL